MGMWGRLVERALRSLRSAAEKHSVDPFEFRQPPNVNRLWYAWLEAFGPQENIRVVDPAEAAQASGTRHIREYLENNDPTVLEQAIEDFSRAVQSTPSGSPRRPMYLSELGGALRERFIRRPQGRADLERMIELFEEAARTVGPRDPFRPSIVNNLGNAYDLKYKLDSDVKDLERAIGCYREALTAEKAGPRRAGWANNLSNALKTYFLKHPSHHVLNEAITLAGEAASSPQVDSRYRAQFLSGLAQGLGLRFELRQQPRDLDEAINVSEKALSMLRGEPLYRAALLFNHGLALSIRFQNRHKIEDLRSVLETWEQAWSIVNENFFRSAVSYKLGQQEQWTNLTIALIQAYLQQSVAEKLDEYRHAALWRALELTEASRSRLLVEMLARAEMPAPVNVPAAVIDREKTLRDMLANLDASDFVAEVDPAIAQPPTGSSSARFQQRQEFVTELEKIWIEIARAGPEAEIYVTNRRGQPLDAQGLMRLADHSGVETLLMSVFPYGNGTALLLYRSGWGVPFFAPLELTTDDWLGTRERLVEEIHNFDGAAPVRETWDGHFLKNLRDLWGILEPLLEDIRRVVIAPYGIGHLIPWAVVIFRAGWRDERGQPIPVVTVPAFSVLAGRQQSHRSNGPALIVGYAGADGKSQLRSRGSEEHPPNDWRKSSGGKSSYKAGGHQPPL